MEYADNTSCRRNANRIVNLTLTSQTSRPIRPKPADGMDAAKPILQTETWARAPESGTHLSLSGLRARQGPGHETSIEPRIFRLLGSAERRRARARPQRHRARTGARTARRYLRAVLRSRWRTSVSRRRDPGLRASRPRPQRGRFSSLVR